MSISLCGVTSAHLGGFLIPIAACGHHFVIHLADRGGRCDGNRLGWSPFDKQGAQAFKGGDRTEKIYAQNVADAKRNTSSGNNEVDAIGSQSLRLRHKCCTALRCRKIGIDIGVTQIDGNNPIATGSQSLRCSLADAANAAGDERDEL